MKIRPPAEPLPGQCRSVYTCYRESREKKTQFGSRENVSPSIRESEIRSSKMNIFLDRKNYVNPSPLSSAAYPNFNYLLQKKKKQEILSQKLKKFPVFNKPPDLAWPYMLHFVHFSYLLHRHRPFFFAYMKANALTHVFLPPPSFHHIVQVIDGFICYVFNEFTNSLVSRLCCFLANARKSRLFLRCLHPAVDIRICCSAIVTVAA